MGVFCLKCESNTKESQQTENQPKSRENDLPKQYINNKDLTEKSEENEGEEGDTIFKFEHDDEQEKLKINKKDDNKNNNINNDIDININIKTKKLESKSTDNNKVYSLKNSYNKSKSSYIKKNEDGEVEDEQTNNIDIDDNKNNNMIIEEIYERKNSQIFQTVKNPKDLKKKLKENKNDKNKRLRKPEVFQRKKKKKYYFNGKF